MTTTLTSSGITMGSSVMNVSGTASSFPSRAWCNFNGVGGASIRASGNVSSITRNSTGDYVVNMATALADANYSASAICNISIAQLLTSTPMTSSTCKIATTTVSFFQDGDPVCFTAIR